MDESKVEAILSPPEVSISEAKNSPRKRKISVTAEVSEVCNLNVQGFFFFFFLILFLKSDVGVFLT